jgi:DNA polymerase III delta prime subunit
MSRELWVEKYRPNNIDGYVFRDTNQKEQIEGWIKQKSIPHLLFSGSAGIGKTTLAKILFKELDIDELDILEINASRTNSVEDVRDKIVNFVQMIPFGDFKVVLLDEADYLSPNAQAALRGVMEEYHSTSRFVLTCNYPHKIIPALHSRCQGFHIEKVDPVEFTARVATILVEENIEFDLETLDAIVKATYPDLRKCINNAQMNSLGGTLRAPNKSDTSAPDYQVEMFRLFKAGKIGDARKLVCGQARPEEMDAIYRWLYDNIGIFGDEAMQEKAILVIKKGILDHGLCADAEINLADTLIRLSYIK